MRRVVLDTETTGLEFSQGHRVIEIGCVEMVGRSLSGRTFNYLINPQRDIDEAATDQHRITVDMLQDKPLFADLAQEFLEFIKGAELIIHNAPFDVGFLNGEFELAGFGKGVIEANCEVLDTLVMARHKHPGQHVSLDALCKRYAVDNSERTEHRALLDAEILADVYLAMTVEQATLLGEPATLPEPTPPPPPTVAERIPTPLIKAGDDDLKAHEQWLQLLEKESQSGAVWLRAGAGEPPTKATP